MTPQQLKNSILQYAIQGKLVEQRKEEGTAEELYQKIQEEKQKLIKEGKIKKQKTLPEITEDEIPFDIPGSWKWIRLGNIIYLLSGADLESSMYSNKEIGIPYITGASNILNNELLINRWTESPKNIANKGDLLITCKGTIGKTHILKENKVHIARQIMSITPFLTNIFYINFFVEGNIEKLKKIAKSMIPGIDRNNILNLKIPLPPLEEQKRIVSKIEELLPFVDDYAKAYEELEKLNAKFPEDMKKSILQHAIQGKLVDQRKEEGTAEELYEKIQEEKEKLIKEGNIKKQKVLPEITEDEIPFDIPESWKWVRMGECCEIYTGNSISESIKKTKYLGLKHGLDYIATKDVNFDTTINYDNGVRIPISDNFKVAKSESILMCIEGGSAGRKIGMLDRDVCFGNKLCMFNSKLVFNRFIFYYLQSDGFKSNFSKNISGIIGGVSINKIKTLFIPLPPLEEQKRIVDKIEKLLPICENLNFK